MLVRTDDRTEEQILIMRAQRGEQDAFRVLVERYQGLVYTLALRILDSHQDAEDAAQDAFLSAWRSLPKFRMDARFSTWLYRLTVNASTDILRKRKHTEANVSLDDEEQPVEVTDSAPTPQERAEEAERAAVFRAALSGLSENHRKVLILREIHGLDYEQIGEVLELSPGTVRSRISRARQALRLKLLESGTYFDGYKSGGETS